MMNNTNKFFNLAKGCLSSILGLALVAGVSSCNGEEEESYLGSLKVTVTAPQTVSVEGVTVTITNTSDLVETTLATDVAGVVEFKDLVAGSYNISATAKDETSGVSYSAVKSGVAVASQKETEVELALEEVLKTSNLVIKEIFYSGASFDYDEWGSCLLKDSFIEIFNNGDEPVSLDGLYIGDAWTPETAESFASGETPILQDETLDHNYVYLCTAARIPEGSNITLAPGKSFILATNAINFKEESRNAIIEMGGEPDEEKIAHLVDLSIADMETYTVTWQQEKGYETDYAEMFDLDNPNVPNVENIFLAYDYAQIFNWNVNGGAPVIFRSDKTYGDDDIITYSYTSSETPYEIPLLKVAVADVLDAADFVSTAESGRWKRFPNVLDKGFNYVPGGDNSNTNYSMRRKVDSEASAAAGRLILMDTNNSSSDFEAVEPPTPGAGYEGYEL